jgi:O-succinylbenzoate synthase
LPDFPDLADLVDLADRTDFDRADLVERVEKRLIERSTPLPLPPLLPDGEAVCWPVAAPEPEAERDSIEEREALLPCPINRWLSVVIASRSAMPVIADRGLSSSSIDMAECLFTSVS